MKMHCIPKRKVNFFRTSSKGSFIITKVITIVVHFLISAI